MPAGRPSEYTKEKADYICERLATGESLRTVCKSDKAPSMKTVFSWMRENPEFLMQYEKAKGESADALVEDMLDIADNQVSQPVLENGIPLVDSDGNIVYAKDAVSVNHAKLRVDTRKWAASKLKPKKYGERVQSDVNINNYTEMSDDELMRKLTETREAHESSKYH